MRTFALVLACLQASAGLAADPPAASLAAPADPTRAPYQPVDGAAVLQQVPSRRDPGVLAMQQLRQKVDAQPRSLPAAIALARAYVDYGREVGDAHYAGYAEAVLAPWLAAKPPAVDVLVLQATILQFRHEFEPARALLQQAVTRDPRHAQAWLTLATLDMAQGRYVAATDDCAQVTRSAGFALGLACAGTLRTYTGQAQQGIALLSQIDADAPSLTPVFKAWVQGLLAEAAERLGDWPLAERHYRAALAFTPADNFLMVAYADFLLDRGRAAEVPALLGDYAQSDTAFLRLALAQAALGRPDAARYTWVMGARFAALEQRGADYYGREQVRFALHLRRDPATALDLAQRNWQVQRAPWDVRVLLEAARAANRPDAAAPVLAFIAETRLQDPVIEGLARDVRAQAAARTQAAR